MDTYEGMPTCWTIQKLMEQHNLSHRQADRFYWFRVEGYPVDRALKMVGFMSKDPSYS